MHYSTLQRDRGFARVQRIRGPQTDAQVLWGLMQSAEFSVTLQDEVEDQIDLQVGTLQIVWMRIRWGGPDATVKRKRSRSKQGAGFCCGYVRTYPGDDDGLEGPGL